MSHVESHFQGVPIHTLLDRPSKKDENGCYDPEEELSEGVALLGEGYNGCAFIFEEEIDRKRRIVLKFSPETMDNSHEMTNLCIDRFSVLRKNDVSPHFPRVYKKECSAEFIDAFYQKYKDSKNSLGDIAHDIDPDAEYAHLHLVEHCNEGSLLDCVATSSLDTVDLRVMLFEIFYTLAVINQRYPEYRHSDLHADNILVYCYDSKSKGCNCYRLNGVDYYLPDTGLITRLWDYEFSTFGKDHLVNTGTHRGLAMGLSNSLNGPYFDVHPILNNVVTSFDNIELEEWVLSMIDDNRFIGPEYDEGRFRLKDCVINDDTEALYVHSDRLTKHWARKKILGHAINNSSIEEICSAISDLGIYIPPNVLNRKLRIMRALEVAFAISEADEGHPLYDNPEWMEKVYEKKLFTKFLELLNVPTLPALISHFESGIGPLDWNTNSFIQGELPFETTASKLLEEHFSDFVMTEEEAIKKYGQINNFYSDTN